MKHRFTTRDHHPGKLAGIRRVLKKFLLLSFLLSSPLPADEIVSETDQLILYRERSGHLAPVHRNPRRVIASIGSLADIWYAAGGKLIALPDVKSKETLPEGARNLPSIGGFSTPNLERILVLKPDLVLLSEKLQTHQIGRAHV